MAVRLGLGKRWLQISYSCSIRLNNFCLDDAATLQLWLGTWL